LIPFIGKKKQQNNRYFKFKEDVKKKNNRYSSLKFDSNKPTSFNTRYFPFQD